MLHQINAAKLYEDSRFILFGTCKMELMKHSENISEILQIRYPLRKRNLDSAFFIEINFNSARTLESQHFKNK